MRFEFNDKAKITESESEFNHLTNWSNTNIIYHMRSLPNEFNTITITISKVRTAFKTRIRFEIK